MNDLDHYVLDIAKSTIQSEKLSRHDWDLVSIVYDVSDSHTANSGFLYVGEEVIPTSIDLDKILRELREAIAEKTGKKFKQLLIQVERETGRIKIEYDFEKGDKWTITPAHLFEMPEELRPKFD